MINDPDHTSMSQLELCAYRVIQTWSGEDEPAHLNIDREVAWRRRMDRNILHLSVALKESCGLVPASDQGEG